MQMVCGETGYYKVSISPYIEHNMNLQSVPVHKQDAEWKVIPNPNDAKLSRILVHGMSSICDPVPQEEDSSSCVIWKFLQDRKHQFLPALETNAFSTPAHCKEDPALVEDWNRAERTSKHITPGFSTSFGAYCSDTSSTNLCKPLHDEHHQTYPIVGERPTGLPYFSDPEESNSGYIKEWDAGKHTISGNTVSSTTVEYKGSDDSFHWVFVEYPSHSSISSGETSSTYSYLDVHRKPSPSEPEKTNLAKKTLHPLIPVHRLCRS